VRGGAKDGGDENAKENLDMEKGSAAAKRDDDNDEKIKDSGEDAKVRETAKDGNELQAATTMRPTTATTIDGGTVTRPTTGTTVGGNV
jgi:hypothetical protein